MKGCFITIEGIEGSGKTTQVQLLSKNLKSLGYPVFTTREPGGSAIAEQIRKILLDENNIHMSPITELLLYAAARAQHVDEIIRPKLEAGWIVISDRFADSTTAYQGIGRGLNLDMLIELHKISTRGTWPDLTIVLDLPVEKGLARITSSGKLDRIEQEPFSFHQKVREGFLILAKQDPKRVKIVDGNRPIHLVADEIKTLVLSFLPSLDKSTGNQP